MHEVNDELALLRRVLSIYDKISGTAAFRKRESLNYNSRNTFVASL